MAQGQTLKAAGQTLARAGGHAQSRGAGRNHMNGNMSATDTIPVAFEFGGPVGDLMYFVEQQERRATFGSGLGIRPASFPETGQRGVRIVACGIDGLIAELLCEFEQQRGLADLSRPGQDLDASWSGFTEPLGKLLAAMGIVVFYFSHSLIIIRL